MLLNRLARPMVCLASVRASNRVLGCKTRLYLHVRKCRLAYSSGCAMHSRTCGAVSDGGCLDRGCAIEVLTCAMRRCRS